MIGTGPYDSLREYVEAIEEHGKLIRIDEIDQDAYELTGFMYKLLDKYGWLGAPAIIVERVKIDGEWIEGPILINQYGMGGHEALVVGVPLDEIDPEDHILNYKKSLEKMLNEVPIEPKKTKEVKASDAPSKEVILKGDEIDILSFPFIQTNPADNGRFINTGNLITIDPDGGRNCLLYTSPSPRDS